MQRRPVRSRSISESRQRTALRQVCDLMSVVAQKLQRRSPRCQLCLRGLVQSFSALRLRLHECGSQENAEKDTPSCSPRRLLTVPLNLPSLQRALETQRTERTAKCTQKPSEQTTISRESAALTTCSRCCRLCLFSHHQGLLLLVCRWQMPHWYRTDGVRGRWHEDSEVWIHLLATTD